MLENMTGIFLVWSPMTYMIYRHTGYPRLISLQDIDFSPTRRRIEPTNDDLKDPNVSKQVCCCPVRNSPWYNVWRYLDLDCLVREIGIDKALENPKYNPAIHTGQT